MHDLFSSSESAVSRVVIDRALSDRQTRLVLLRHKFLRCTGGVIEAAQHGHRGKLLTRARTSRHDCLQTGTVRSTQTKLGSLVHTRDSHAYARWGIHKRIEPSELIHSSLGQLGQLDRRHAETVSASTAVAFSKKPAMFGCILHLISDV